MATYIFVLKKARAGCSECEIKADYPVIIEANTDEIAIKAAFKEFYKPLIMGQHDRGFESIELYRIDKNLTSALNEEKNKRGIKDDPFVGNEDTPTIIPIVPL